MKTFRAIALIAVLLTSTLAIGPEVQANHGTLNIASYRLYTDGADALHVYGVVANDTFARYRDVQVTISFRDAGNQVIDTESASTMLDELTPHAKSPFEIVVASPPVYTTYLISVTGTTMTGQSRAPLRMATTSLSSNGTSLQIDGTVTNRSSHALTATMVTATLYNGSGVLSTGVTTAAPAAIGPNGSTTFSVIIDELAEWQNYTRIHLQAQAETDGGGYAASWDHYFGDLGGTSFRDDVIWLAEEGITGGCAEGLYCPTKPVTRGEMASFLSRALNLPSTTTDYFTDDDGTTHEIAINRVAHAGITGGCADGLYCPTATVTRAQMASFLSRALGLVDGGGIDYFTDDDGSTHEIAINRVAHAGITTGCAPSTYCPLASVTRGQMAAFLMRALD